MFFVQITDGIDADQNPVKGVFPLLTVNNNPEGAVPGEGGLRDQILVIGNANDPTIKRGVAVWKEDWFMSGDMGFNMFGIQHSPAEVDKEKELSRIKKRFDVMNILSDGVIEGNIRSYIMAGSAGIGKSYNLFAKMEAAYLRGKITKYEIVKGRVSGIVLYKMLYEHSERGQALILDDVDVFSDEVTLDILKAATDTNQYRVINWSTTSPWLEEHGVPYSFEFNGAVVFVSNKNFDKEMASGSRTAVHLRALIDRAIYLDLLVHEPLQIMIWTEHVLRSSQVLQKKSINGKSLTEDDVEEIICWMWHNYIFLRTLSIRTAEKLADFVLMDHENWRDLAACTMIVGCPWQ